MRFKVDPRKVKRVEMTDGTRYDVGRNGTVQIDRPDHLDQLRRRSTDALNAERILEPVRLTAPRMAGRSCAGCGFAAWPWQRTCPRCGGETA